MSRFNFGAFKKTVTDVVSSAAHGARELAFDAKEALERALVAKCLRPYIVKHQTGTAGPRGLWKIYAADFRNPGTGGHYPSVSVWILDKKVLQESAKGRIKTCDVILEQQKAGAARLLRLKHPSILKVMEPLEETRTQYVMVTEPIFCSLSDWLSYFSDVPDVQESIKEIVFSELEIKHGILQLASAVSFLNDEANLAHCAISPESVLVCADGHWALANMGFATDVDFTGTKTITSFDYSDPYPSPDLAAVKPNLQFIAPEIATGRGDDMSVQITKSVDVFSFGLLMHCCLTRVSLLAEVEDSIWNYRARVKNFNTVDLSVLPPQLQPAVRSMIAQPPAQRPAIASVSSFGYFQEDVLLRALQFLEGMVGKDPMQKASFLKDLETFWPKFDQRTIRYKVVPPLMQELHIPTLQSLIIPFIFRAAGSQSQDEFMTHTLPKLKSVLEVIKGEALNTVLTNCDPLTKVMTRSAVAEVLLPIFLRAFDEKSTKIQEDALRKAQSIFDCLDYQSLKSQVLPKLHSLSMKTVSAKVRINCLVLMGHLVPRLDKDEAKKMMATCAQITKVDMSPGTLMCVLGVGDSISKHWGEELTAQMVIPLLSPLLVAKTLSHQQFGTFTTIIRDMLGRIESKVGKQIKESQPLQPESGRKSEQMPHWDELKPVARPNNAAANQSPPPFLSGKSTAQTQPVSMNAMHSGISQTRQPNWSAPGPDPFAFVAMNGALPSGTPQRTQPAPSQQVSSLMDFGSLSKPTVNIVTPTVGTQPQLDFFSDFQSVPAQKIDDPFAALDQNRRTQNSADPFADLI